MASQNQKSKKLSPITWILIGVLAIMLFLIIFTIGAVNSVTAKNARGNMETVAAQNAKIITDYVAWAEDTLDFFAYAGQIKDFLLDPDDPAKKQIAQKLTDEYGEDVGEYEGLYIASWDGITLTHINHDTIGTAVREGDRLKQLQDKLIECGDQVYTGGIVTSPSTGAQVLAIYKAIYDGNKPIGFIGCALLTENVLYDISTTQIAGLEKSSYILLNAADNVYLFDATKANIGTVCPLPDLQNINEQLRSGAAEDTGTGEFKDGAGVKQTSTYYYMRDYGWTLIVNAPSKDVYSMGRQLQAFLIIFGFLIIALVTVFGIINAHQEAVARRLGKQLQKTEATEASLQTAMFKDILTEVQNRVAFSEDLDKVQPDADHPCYFAMFDISELAVINAQFGNDAGDAVLCNTAEALTKAFPDGTVYRTGDDEFVIAIKKDDNSTATYNQVFREITEAHGELLKPQDTGDGQINVAYKIALVRTTSELSTTVVSILKDIANRNGRTVFGQVNFVDMDQM